MLRTLLATVVLSALMLLYPVHARMQPEGFRVPNDTKPLPTLENKPHATYEPLSVIPINARDFVWTYLSKHFTREQTAGIMGNLRQEHNFNTSDVAGGLGLAQWIGGRRTRLMAKPNYDTLTGQLDFLVEELNGNESAAGNAIRSATTVEQATVAFESLFERCGDCRTGTRIQYAYEILASY